MNLTIQQQNNLDTFKKYVISLKDSVELIQVNNENDVKIANELIKECISKGKELEENRTSITKPINDALRELNAICKEIDLNIEEVKNKAKSKLLEYNRKIEAEQLAEKNRIIAICNEMVKQETKEGVEGMYNFLKESDKQNSLILNAKNTAIFQIEEKERLEIERKKREDEQKKLDELKESQDKEKAELEAERIRIEQQKRDNEAEKIRLDNEEKKRIADLEAKANEKLQTQDSGVKGIRKDTKFEIIDGNLVDRQYCSPDEKKIKEAIKNGVKEIFGVRIYEVESIIVK